MRALHELRALLLVAVVAELGLRLRQGALGRRGGCVAGHHPVGLHQAGRHRARLVDLVAVDASHAVLCVDAAGPLHRVILSMAGEAGLVDVRVGAVLQPVDVGGRSTLDVRRPGAVARLALLVRCLVLEAGERAVRRAFELLGDLLVAGRTGVHSDRRRCRSGCLSKRAGGREEHRGCEPHRRMSHEHEDVDLRLAGRRRPPRWSLSKAVAKQVVCWSRRELPAFSREGLWMTRTQRRRCPARRAEPRQSVSQTIPL